MTALAPDHPTRRAAPKKRDITLALQGGGAHGAFTWGVLDGLVADGRIHIEGISGTSAGAVNGTVFVDGFIRGGAAGALENLRSFWEKVSNSGFQSLLGLLPTGWSQQMWNLDDTGAFAMFDLVTRMFSPYELNPFDINPLRDILERMIDFPAMRSHREIKLFVTATNVKTCKPKVFRTGDMSVDILLASACVPLLFKAVEVDGEHYWDGGYMGNPSIYPLIQNCRTKDVVIVQINPLQRSEVPTKSRDILNRITELSFNSSLVREMRGFATITALIDAGKLTDERYSKVHFHMIEPAEDLSALGVSSKFNTDWRFLEHLHDLGVDTARRWLEKTFDDLNQRSSIDVFRTFV